MATVSVATVRAKRAIETFIAMIRNRWRWVGGRRIEKVDEEKRRGRLRHIYTE